MDSQRFRSLALRLQALVAVAVLLDGREAATYLENDSLNGPGLKRVATDLAMLETELRVPFVGTMLRVALAEMGEDK